MQRPEVLENTDCVFCGSTKSLPVYRRIDARYYLDENVYTMSRCCDCGGHFLSTRVKEECIELYYPEEYYFTEQSPDRIWKNEFRKNYRKYNRYLAELEPGTLLDFGCRDGSFVKFMQLFGWQAEGFDKSSKAGNPFGCKILYDDIHSYSSNTFDVVTLWAVLEHLYDPNRYLRFFHKVLKPGRYLLIQVPMFNSFTGKFLLHEDVPRHVSAFNSKWLEKYVNSFGFRLIELDTRCRVFFGSSEGSLEYFARRLVGQTQDTALLAIYQENKREQSSLKRFDRRFARYFDILLRRADYWGQMTAVFQKQVDEIS